MMLAVVTVNGALLSVPTNYIGLCKYVQVKYELAIL